MANDTLMTEGRKRTVNLITPREFLYVRDVEIASAVAEADRDALREGMWMVEKASTATGPSELKLTPDDESELVAPATIGLPRMIFADGDRADIMFSGKAPVICGVGWIARSKHFKSTSVDPGDYLTILGGASVTGDYGKLEIWAANKVAVARCLWVGTEWIEFVAIDPRKLD